MTGRLESSAEIQTTHFIVCRFSSLQFYFVFIISTKANSFPWICAVFNILTRYKSLVTFSSIINYMMCRFSCCQFITDSSKWWFLFIFSTKSTQDKCKYSGCKTGNKLWGYVTLLFTKHHSKNRVGATKAKVWISWKKADTNVGTVSLWDKDMGPQCSASSSEARLKVKLSTERADYMASLDKRWALSSLTHVFVRKKKAGEGNQSVGKVYWQNLYWRWEECKAEKPISLPREAAGIVTWAADKLPCDKSEPVENTLWTPRAGEMRLAILEEGKEGGED